MRRVYNRSRYLSIGEVWRGAMIQRYMGTGRFYTSNSFIWEIAPEDSWGETNVFRSSFFLNEKLSIFSTNHRFSWQIWPPVSQSYLRAPDLSPDIFSLPRKSRPPRGSWGKGEGLWRWVCDRQQRDVINDGKPALPTKTTLSIYKLMDGMSLKANRYLSVQMLFVFLCELSQMGWCKEATLVVAARGAAHRFA